MRAGTKRLRCRLDTLRLVSRRCSGCLPNATSHRWSYCTWEAAMQRRTWSADIWRERLTLVRWRHAAAARGCRRRGGERRAGVGRWRSRLSRTPLSSRVRISSRAKTAYAPATYTTTGAAPNSGDSTAVVVHHHRQPGARGLPPVVEHSQVEGRMVGLPQLVRAAGGAPINEVEGVGVRLGSLVRERDRRRIEPPDDDRDRAGAGDRPALVPGDRHHLAVDGRNRGAWGAQCQPLKSFDQAAVERY